MNQQEQQAIDTALDNCEVLRARLAKYEDADGVRYPLVWPQADVMAKTLSDRCADQCQVDRDDYWKQYGDDCIDDVKAMLAAAPKPADHSEDVRALLEAAVYEMGDLIGMMEPYYSQCNADKNANELIERIQAVLPPPPKPYVAPPLCCDLCEGNKAKRVFKTSDALCDHRRHVHSQPKEQSDE
jgi:hypothetical protein